MAQWTFIDPNTLLPGDPWTSAKAQAAFENLEAVAEGAPGAPRIQTDALQNSAVTTAKIANGDVTRTKLAVGTRSFSGSIPANSSVSISYSDNFAFVPRVGGTNNSAEIIDGAFRLSNGSSSSNSYSITWRYLTT